MSYSRGYGGEYGGGGASSSWSDGDAAELPPPIAWSSTAPAEQQPATVQGSTQTWTGGGMTTKTSAPGTNTGLIIAAAVIGIGLLGGLWYVTKG